MKFGNQLSKVVAYSDPEWGPMWMNYNQLKKTLKDLTTMPLHANLETADHGPQGKENTTPAQSLVKEEDPAAVERKEEVESRPEEEYEAGRRPALVQDLMHSSLAVTFFRQVHVELRKSAEFFIGMEHQMLLRRKRIKQSISYLRQPDLVHDDGAWTRMRRACIAFYKDLLLLENFAVMNYCGFSKIVKKFDKLTGYSTRERFMKNIMNNQPFTHYPRLLDMLQDVENTFRELDDMEGNRATPMEHCDSMRENGELSFEAIRGMKAEASSFETEERRGLGTPDSTVMEVATAIWNLQASIVPNCPLPPPMVESDPSLAVMLGLEASVTRTATINGMPLSEDPAASAEEEVPVPAKRARRFR